MRTALLQAAITRELCGLRHVDRTQCVTHLHPNTLTHSNFTHNLALTTPPSLTDGGCLLAPSISRHVIVLRALIYRSTCEPLTTALPFSFLISCLRIDH